MKSLKILVIALCLGFQVKIYAQSNLNSAQKDFQKEIMSFLKEEGYLPYLESGIIKLKIEGETHNIQIYKESPFFIIFNRSGYSLGEEKDLLISILACNEVNKEMEAVKLYCTDESVIFNIEQYTQSAEDFKYVFHKNWRTLADAEKKFIEKYNEFKEKSESLSGQEN